MIVGWLLAGSRIYQLDVPHDLISLRVMRNVFLFMVLVFLGGLSGARAAEPDVQQVLSPTSRETTRHSQTLDDLFHALKREGNVVEAERTANKINAELARSGSSTIDLMMKWSADALKNKKYSVALDFLDQVITLRPDFAEAFNRRATVHFAMQNYAKSMADIERTVELEPRHIGAMAGLAQIMKSTGRKELALRAYERVLSVYPAFRQAQDEVGRLADELAGERA